MAEPAVNKENQWLLKIAEGDEFAFRQLVNSYYNKLGSFVLGLTGSRQLTEEIVQDIFLKVWQGREDLGEIKKFDSWLFILTRNHCFNCLKQISREQRRRMRWEQDILAAGPTTEELQEQDDRHAELLEQAIDQLPPQQRKVYILSRREGLSSLDITERLGLSIDTVKKHRSRAAQNVKAYLLRHLTISLFFFL